MDISEIDRLFNELNVPKSGFEELGRKHDEESRKLLSNIYKIDKEIERPDSERKNFLYTPISKKIIYDGFDYENEAPEILFHKSGEIRHEQTVYIKKEFQDDFFMAFYKQTRKRIPLQSETIFDNRSIFDRSSFYDIEYAIEKITREIIISKFIQVGYDIKGMGGRYYLPDLSDITIYEYSSENLELLNSDEGFRHIEKIEDYIKEEKS